MYCARQTLARPVLFKFLSVSHCLCRAWQTCVYQVFALPIFLWVIFLLSEVLEPYSLLPTSGWCSVSIASQSRTFSCLYVFPVHVSLFCSVTQSYPTLCDPMDSSTPGLPVHHQLPNLLKLMSIKSMMPSKHLILCHPLLLLPSIFPRIRVFSNESILRLQTSAFSLHYGDSRMGSKDCCRGWMRSQMYGLWQGPWHREVAQKS